MAAPSGKSPRSWRGAIRRWLADLLSGGEQFPPAIQPPDTRDVAAVARDKLAYLRNPQGDDMLIFAWWRAAMETVLSGVRVNPPMEVLRRITTPEQVVADLDPWPSEQLFYVTALISSTLLSIESGDRDWMRQLYASWGVLWTKPGEEFVEWDRDGYERGRLGLALGADGPQPHGWDGETYEFIAKEIGVDDGAPANRAWWQIATGDLEGARRSLDAAWDAAEAWERDVRSRRPIETVSRFTVDHDRFLRMEERALEAILSRRGLPGRPPDSAAG